MRRGGLSSLVACEEGALLALEELLAAVAVSVVPPQALHVARTELAELAGQHAVAAHVGQRRAAARRAQGRLGARGQLVVAELLTDVLRLQVRRV